MMDSTIRYQNKEINVKAGLKHGLKVDTTNLLALLILEKLGNVAPTQEQIDLTEMFLLWPETHFKKEGRRLFTKSNNVAFRIICRSLNSGVVLH